jgi:hypothetical protein
MLDNQPPESNVSAHCTTDCKVRGSTKDLRAITRTVFRTILQVGKLEGFKNGQADPEVAFYTLAGCLH